VAGPGSNRGQREAVEVAPEVVAELYGRWIMPLTKQVQVDYLLRRLDPNRRWRDPEYGPPGSWIGVAWTRVGTIGALRRLDPELAVTPQCPFQGCAGLTILEKRIV